MGFFKRLTEPEEAPEQNRPSGEGGRLEELRKAVEDADLPDQAAKAACRELDRLGKMEPSAAEYGIGLNYIDFILGLPWRTASMDNLDLAKAARVMDDEHAGLGQVKERVLEYLALSIMRASRAARLLVVDDEPVALDNVSHILRKEGYEVATAQDGSAALSLLEQSEYDLVITDLKMPRTDGMQLLEGAKTVSPRTAFIMVTGYATVENAVETMRLGAAYYLPKPLNLDVLRSTVRDVLASRRPFQSATGPVLCFAGPPGTGKTSVGRSIASALGRKFVRLSMAGLRDEAELRGHRRTYVGALPGRVLTEIKNVGVNNPVFMLDELDKIGQDFRGDPASVLLEVLDPEQNGRFLDYYLDTPFPLSEVMFIATANVVERLPAPLLDRLEIITFPSYTLGEKRRIARGHLLPRQLRAHGLSASDMDLTDGALDTLVMNYTREAGVRNLERELATVCRKMVRRVLETRQGSDGAGTGRPETPETLDEAGVAALLGPARFHHEAAEAPALPGVTTGMVWTEYGGEIIFVETARMKGRGNLILTGSLGEVLKESAQTALSYVRSRAEAYGIDQDFFAGSDIHVHIPAGATPKDGPSAGVTIAAALLSLLTGRPARRDVAMSGELSLSGQLLPVSGIREKILAAQQAGVETVVLPRRNEQAVRGLDPEVREAVRIVLADSVEEVADAVLLE